MEGFILGIILVVYLAWAIYSGWKFMDGRVRFLEKRGIVYLALKIWCSGTIGLFYGFVYIFVVIRKLFQ